MQQSRFLGKTPTRWKSPLRGQLTSLRRIVISGFEESWILKTKCPCISALESLKSQKEIRLRSYENWSHGLGHSQEGLRREKPYRKIGKSEIRDSRGQRTLDIEDQEIPNLESISFLLMKRQHSECRGP